MLACLLCSKSSVVRILISSSSAGLKIGICTHCGAGMLLETIETDSEKYSNLYEEELDNSKGNNCWNILQEQVSGLQDKISLLDIGCGRGTFLDIAKEYGLRTVGIELASDAALIAKNKGHKILCGSATEIKFSERKFDIITLWDLLEHLDNPRQVLLNTYESLRSDGKMFILTPMMGSIYDRLGLLLFRLSGGRVAMLVRMCWSHEHLWRFDAYGLKNILLSIGFKEVYVQPVLLLSLMPDRYAGGEILASWTGQKMVDAFLSRFGVWTAKKLNFYNKIIVKAIK